MTAPQIARFRRRLLTWYQTHKRELPWRATKDPYRVWLSEVMLQQTRVAAVSSYYARFLEKFPTVQALASAPEADVLAAWSGLGYYSRARNLQAAARRVVTAGSFPRDYDGWRELPGVGDYTAAAVASIAFNFPAAVLDGNVNRVLARLFAERGPVDTPAVRARQKERASLLLAPRTPGDFNQAMMELGATVCIPVSPRCPHCPVARWCRARASGSAALLPVKQKKRQGGTARILIALALRKGCVALQVRGATQRLMPGFWELPAAPSNRLRAERIIGGFRHSILDTLYIVQVVRNDNMASPELRWVPLAELPSLPLTTMTRKALALAGVATR